MKTKIPDNLTIQQYLEGKLNPELAHQLEKQALDDPFLWEALEGYSVYRDPAADLSILQRQLHERIMHLQENKKVFDLSWQRLSVAAAAAVMFVSAGILFWMNSQKLPEQLASQSQKSVEVNVIDKDSVQSVIGAKNESIIASIPAASSTLDSSQAKITRTKVNAALSNAVGVSKYNNLPKSGWLSYQEYLDRSTKKFVSNPRLTGSVLLSFQVRSEGKVTNIKVIKSLSGAYDEQAIQIIRNGSDWTPPADGKTYEAQVELNFP